MNSGEEIGIVPIVIFIIIILIIMIVGTLM